MVLNSASAAVTFTNQCFSFLIKAACLHGNLSGSCFLIERSHRRRNTAALWLGTELNLGSLRASQRHYPSSFQTQDLHLTLFVLPWE
jgi:hypothetical protein